MSDTKLCKDCRHYTPGVYFGCKAPVHGTDVVTGQLKAMSPYIARSALSPKWCGPSAKHFTPKDLLLQETLCLTN